MILGNRTCFKATKKQAKDKSPSGSFAGNYHKRILAHEAIKGRNWKPEVALRGPEPLLPSSGLQAEANAVP